MRRVYTVLFMLFSFRSVIADEVILQHDGLTLNAELTLAAGRTIPDGVIVMLHGTLGHNAWKSCPRYKRYSLRTVATRLLST